MPRRPRKPAGEVRAKRIYAPRTPDDGLRVLVMRMWPRGVKKSAIDEWRRELAPSVELVQDFLKKKTLTFAQYRRRYLAELKSRPEAEETLARLADLAKRGESITLLCWCPDESACHRSIVRELVSSRAKGS